jgi:hypothetical protein
LYIVNDLPETARVASNVPGILFACRFLGATCKKSTVRLMQNKARSPFSHSASTD